MSHCDWLVLLTRRRERKSGTRWWKEEKRSRERRERLGDEVVGCCMESSGPCTFFLSLCLLPYPLLAAVFTGISTACFSQIRAPGLYGHSSSSTRSTLETSLLGSLWSWEILEISQHSHLSKLSSSSYFAKCSLQVFLTLSMLRVWFWLVFFSGGTFFPPQWYYQAPNKLRPLLCVCSIDRVNAVTEQ